MTLFSNSLQTYIMGTYQNKDREVSASTNTHLFTWLPRHYIMGFDGRQLNLYTENIILHNSKKSIIVK